jgi:protein-S-isoprenylcysteine O-methyltransferase Ste14
MFVLKLIYGVVAQIALFGLLLLVPAGRWAWPRAWIYMGCMVAGTVATMIYLRNDEALINERLKGPIQKGQPLADRIVLGVFLVTFAGLMIFIPLDVFRFHLMGEPGALVSIAGLILFAAGWWVIALALHENAFAAPVIKYQKERGQRVIDSGVYAKVRHPMYSGFIPFIVGTCLWLGSYAAALLSIVPIAVIATRIVIEERFLRRELEGYAAYVERTPYRLIPFVW